MNKKISFPPFAIADLLRQIKQFSRAFFPSFVIASVAKQSLFLSFRTNERNLKLSLFTSVIASVAKQSLFFPLRAYTVSAAISLLTIFTLPFFAFAEEKIPVFPTTPVEAYAVYTSLAILWVGIIGLIVVIKMKLYEIERIQKLGIDEENENAPVLD